VHQLKLFLSNHNNGFGAACLFHICGWYLQRHFMMRAVMMAPRRLA